MGDDPKNKDTNDAGDKNKKESSGRNKDRDKNKNGSCYSGSYLSWSSGDSSGNSAVSDDGKRHVQKKHHGQKKRQSKNTKRERTKRGKISKARGRSTKRMDKKRKKQTRRLADDVGVEGPSKALSICTVMSKASTQASSRSAYSNDGYASEGNQKKFCKLGRDERRRCVNMLLKKMRAARKSSKLIINDKENDKSSDERMDEDEGDDGDDDEN